MFFQLQTSESAEDVQKMLQNFKNCSINVQKVQTIISDKEFSELKAVEEEFPHCISILCQFHAITAMQRHDSLKGSKDTFDKIKFDYSFINILSKCRNL